MRFSVERDGRPGRSVSAKITASGAVVSIKSGGRAGVGDEAFARAKRAAATSLETLTAKS